MTGEGARTSGSPREQQQNPSPTFVPLATQQRPTHTRSPHAPANSENRIQGRNKSSAGSPRSSGGLDQHPVLAHAALDRLGPLLQAPGPQRLENGHQETRNHCPRHSRGSHTHHQIPRTCMFVCTSTPWKGQSKGATATATQWAGQRDHTPPQPLPWHTPLRFFLFRQPKWFATPSRSLPLVVRGSRPWHLGPVPRCALFLAAVVVLF